MTVVSMSDLVRQLRECANTHNEWPTEGMAKMLMEAADRIEWLEGRAGAISQGINEMGNAVHEASETNRRLGRILNGG